jgi:hypothetical protein
MGLAFYPGLPSPRGELNMSTESPHESYQHAADHWAECPVCTSAGGEQADPYDLCVTGQDLLLTCEEAEKNWLLKSTDAYA